MLSCHWVCRLVMSYHSSWARFFRQWSGLNGCAWQPFPDMAGHLLTQMSRTIYSRRLPVDALQKAPRERLARIISWRPPSANHPRVELILPHLEVFDRLFRAIIARRTKPICSRSVYASLANPAGMFIRDTARSMRSRSASHFSVGSAPVRAATSRSSSANSPYHR
jgi:hypothetical protein